MTSDSEFQLSPSPMQRWYALYTRGRHEKFVDTELKKKKIESFLPLRRIKRRWADRMVVVEEPLFTSYVFVKTDLKCNSVLLRTKGAVKFVSSGMKPIPIEDSVIHSLKNIVRREISLDPFPYLKTGNKVYVRSGFYKGIEGCIVRKDDKKCRLVISIDAIMASISIEVDSCLVEQV